MKHKISTAEMQNKEKELLRQGMSYQEVSAIMGVPQCSVFTRNRNFYHIDQQQCFAKKMQLDGFPCNLNIEASFGSWFSGFFDGEGCLKIAHFRRSDSKISHSLDIGLAIKVRKDDKNVLNYIMDNLNCGCLCEIGSYKTTHKSASFSIHDVKTLTEIIVPLFERYPLKTKKRKEFDIWKGLVKKRYIRTLGGKTKNRIQQQDIDDFIKASSKIQSIRHPLNLD